MAGQRAATIVGAMNIKKIEDRITKQLAEQIQGTGLKLKTPEVIACAWGEGEAQARCAARKARAATKSLVTLMIGIRFESVERLLAKPRVSDQCPTLVAPIKSLQKDELFSEWDTDDSGTIGILARQVHTYAIPFYEKYTDLDFLKKTLELDERPFPFWLSSEQRIPTLAAILASKGKKSAAVTLLDDEIKRGRSTLSPLRDRILTN